MTTEDASWKRLKVDQTDPRFPSLQQGFNRRWVGTKLDSIYLVHNVKGVAAALDDAVQNFGCDIQIVSGGHCYEDFVFNDRIRAVINVTALTEYGYDDDKGFYLSSGDTNWNSFVNLFREYGKVLPGGSCYSVGLGGHISGGGDGILSRLHGLTVDYLTAVEVVVKPDLNSDAIIKTVSRDCEDEKDKDLFWAHTGGGGGNFGVITKYYFKVLPDAPKGIIASNITFKWDDLIEDEQRFHRIMAWYYHLAETAPRNTVGKFQIAHRSAGEFVMFLYSSYSNDEERADACRRHNRYELELEAIMPLSSPTRALAGHGGWIPFPLKPRKKNRARDGVLDDETIDYPMYALTQTINSSGPNQRGKYKSAYMTQAFPTEQINAIYCNLQTCPPGLEPSDMTDSLLQVDIFGGKINDVAPHETAIAQRSYLVKLQYQTYWHETSKDEGHLQWIRDFYGEMYEPYGGVPNPKYPIFEGCYYNYPDSDLNEWKGSKMGALELYFLGNLPRLIRAKSTWDPNNIFSHAQSIPVDTITAGKH